MLDQGGVVKVVLCTSCVNISTCVNRAVRGYDVLFCDTFEDSGLVNINDDNTPTSERQVSHLNRERVKKKSKFALKGLCQNCVQRDNCVLPRPKTGVWHCEEYS